MAQVGIYESLPGTMQPHHHNASADGDFLWADVRNFGAVVDGVTDDTAAVQAAINTGLGVFFPIGMCLTGRLLPLDYTRLFGMGLGSKIKLKNATENDLIYGLNKTGISIENLFLDGNKAGQVGTTFHTLKLEGCVDSYVDKVFLQNGAYANFTLKNCQRIFGSQIFSKNPGAVGVYLVGTSDSILSGINHRTDVGGASGYHAVLLYNGSVDNEISDVFVRAAVRLSGVTFNVNCHRNKLAHARFIGCENGVEINLSDYWELEDIFSDNNLVALGNESGIEIINSHYGRFLGGILRRNVGAGLQVHTGSHDNLFQNILAELNGWSGFYSNGSIRNKFSSCKSINNVGRGYLLEAASTYNELLGCDAETNGIAGGYLGVEINASNYNKILGGFFKGNGGWGIGEAGGSNWTQVRNVFTKDNVSGGVNLSGAQSVQTDNMSL